MHRRLPVALKSLPFAAVLMLSACMSAGGDDDDDDNGTGGTAGTGGTVVAGTGGASAGTGGSAAGSGGSSGTATLPADPACPATGRAWQTSEQYGQLMLERYFIRNNMWNATAPGAGTQTLWINSARCWGVDSTHTDAAPKGTVKSYADIARGWAISTPGFANPAHGLNIRVSDLRRANIHWKMVAPTTGRTWALWDIYFHETNNPGADRAPMNLMIQQRIVDSDGWMQSDSNPWPRVMIGGYTFRQKLETTSVSSTRNRVQLYIDQSVGSVLGVDDMTLDLKAVIDFYVAQGSIKSTDYLTSIQAGWEIVSGGTYETKDFWTAVQDEPQPAQ
jgi:hypothetical protein